MHITKNRRIGPRAALRGAALLLALGAGVVHAQADGVATEEMAQRIYDRLALVPAGDATPRITVQVVDGRYEVAGFVDGNTAHADAMSALEGIEGLDMSLIDDRIIRQ